MSADVDQGGIQSYEHGHRTFLLIFSALIVVASLALVAYLVINRQPLDRPSYNIVVALTCFTASSVSAILFASSNIRLKGNLGVFALTLGGPATLWLIAFVVMTKLVGGPIPLEALEGVKSAVAALERTEHWMPFNEWLKDLKELSPLFRGSVEEQNIQFLLSGAYIQGGGRDKLTTPEIDTLFAYTARNSAMCQGDRPADGATPELSIKFQRIRGEHAAQQAQVFVTSNATTPDARVESVILSRSRAGVEVVEPKQGPWLEIPSKPVDVLVVSSYCDPADKGDWIHVHTLKYMKENDVAQIRIGVVTPRRINREDTHLWEIRGTTFRDSDGTVPLLMRDINVESRADVTPLIASLGQWMKDLELLTKDTSPAHKDQKEFLGNILNAVRAPGSDYFASFSNQASYEVKSSNSVIMTFMWGAAVPVAPSQDSSATDAAK